MKKAISILLLCAMLASLAACGNGTTPETEDNTPVAESDTVADTVETELKPDLPTRDLAGYEYRILSTEDTCKFIYAAESTGEVVNDAVYNSNAAVGEQFNLKFTTIPITSNSDTKIIQSYILAGEDAYDVAQLHDCTSGSMSLNGWFHNIYDVPYIDTTKPWWPQFTVDSLTLNGKMYVISNYTTYRAMHETRVTFFNRDMIEDLAMESPYDLVKEGTWTIDKIASMTKDVYVDVNGDGKQDKGDTMGFTFTNAPYCWLESFGVETYEKVAPDSAEMVLNANSEQVVNLVLEHESCEEIAGDGGHDVGLLHAFDLVILKRAVAHHERVDQIDARVGVHRENLHEARMLAFHAVGQRWHLGQLERNKLGGEFHRSYAPFFCCAIAFAFSSRMSIACTTPSIIASGRTAQPGTYTSTGIALSTPPSTL